MENKYKLASIFIFFESLSVGLFIGFNPIFLDLMPVVIIVIAFFYCLYIYHSQKNRGGIMRHLKIKYNEILKDDEKYNETVTEEFIERFNEKMKSSITISALLISFSLPGLVFLINIYIRVPTPFNEVQRIYFIFSIATFLFSIAFLLLKLEISKTCLDPFFNIKQNLAFHLKIQYFYIIVS